MVVVIVFKEGNLCYTYAWVKNFLKISICYYNEWVVAFESLRYHINDNKNEIKKAIQKKQI